MCLFFSSQLFLLRDESGELVLWSLRTRRKLYKKKVARDHLGTTGLLRVEFVGASCAAGGGARLLTYASLRLVLSFYLSLSLSHSYFILVTFCRVILSFSDRILSCTLLIDFLYFCTQTRTGSVFLVMMMMTLLTTRRRKQSTK